MAGWEDAERVLCVRLDALGDVLMTTPALRALKSSRPGRHITLFTSSSGASIAALVPEIDDVIVYAAPWIKATQAGNDASGDRAMIEQLRGMRFDAAAIFTVYSQNPLPAATFCCLADIPLRLAHCRENPYHLLTDWVPEIEPGRLVRHEVQRQLDLVGAVGCTTPDDRLSLRVDPAHASSVSALLPRPEHGTRRKVVIHPGASAPSRRYPASHFAAAARGIFMQLDCDIVFTGTLDERRVVEAIRREAAVPSVSVAGDLAMGELVALIDSADVLVSNNTGPAHIAAALGTPVVDLYALTNPQHTPWRVASRVLFHDVPCRYCYKSVCPEGHHDCLQRVEPAAVVAAVRELLEQAKPSAALPLPPVGPRPPETPAPPLAPGLAPGGRA